ncbi:gamma-glutamyltransferase [Seohaeicola sp. SP36]|uniref:gamma-glutamyltransferase n=1 Tax=unclassified Seohaeicola TaxID=2641111 RepID=UPI00237A5620|nr:MULTISPECIES: gamma-glutamyltransferase [unclassified Seohaeicola]MDD9709084.1 gamma-glutamyltransferase [Seohaeicola sp. 4SK31]MDD9737204.1 gamma-glutamyltransferase [Seohaeicola sp. SP36]
MKHVLLTLVALCGLAAAASAQQAADSVAPEAASARAKAEGRPVVAQDWMVVAAHPLASQAGADVLAAGGTAADAMVAVQAVLGLVEPQSSGLGGGAFLVWYDAASGQVTTLDGRETAPLAATPRLFQDASGEPLKFFEAVVGGRSVGTPGTPALMAQAHLRWGRSDWSGLLDPAIRLAEEGFAVSPRLATLVAGDAERLAVHPDTAAYFLPGGVPLAEGDTLRNPAYADTLRLFAQLGTDGFYTGPVAESIVAAVQGAAGNPGVLDMVDLAIYRVKERAPVCAPYRFWQVCGMGPPSSGALAVGQILGMLQGHDLAALGPDNPESWRLIGDASRMAFADRGRYVADSDFVPVPVQGMLDPSYLQGRAILLAGDDALPEVTPGTPDFDHTLLWADGDTLEQPSTTHVSIVDSYGNVLSMTSTIENAFGARVMAGGFLLNNELTDFSFRSHDGGVPIANRVEPGKRPRSSMAPTIVMRDGVPVLAIGSPGGSSIIGYVAQALIAHLDWGMNVQQAVSMGHALNRFGVYDLEDGTDAAALAEPLQAMGYEVKIGAQTSGLHAIAITADGLQGGADPRREGVALGK